MVLESWSIPAMSERICEVEKEVEKEIENEVEKEVEKEVEWQANNEEEGEIKN